MSELLWFVPGAVLVAVGYLLVLGSSLHRTRWRRRD